MVAKYCDHLPLYRQAAILERDAGAEIGRATLDGWVMRVGELLEPVVAAMRQDLLRALRTCKPTRQSFRCRCTTSAERISIKLTYGNTASREEKRYSNSAWAEDAEVHRNSSGQWEGILQTDGYLAYGGTGGPEAGACGLLGARPA